MCITMCKKSGYLVQNLLLVHNKYTLDELSLIDIVSNWGFVQYLLATFNKLIHRLISFTTGIISTYTLNPQELLLLLLSIKLNIINKTVKKGRLN